MSRSPSLFSTRPEATIRDGSFDIPVTLTSSEPERPLHEPLRVVFANGYGCDSRVVRRLAQGVAHVASTEQLALEIATYDEPCSGTSAYGLCYKAGRLEAVAKDMFAGRKGVVVAHSQANHAALDVAGHWNGNDGQIEGMVAYTPVWIGEPIDEELLLLQGFGREAKYMPRLVWNLGALGAMNRVTANGLSHVRRGLRPWGRDIKSIFAKDETRRMVNASYKMGMRTLLATYDGLVPAEATTQRLVDHGFPKEHISEVPTSHTGAVTAVRTCARPLYEALVAVSHLNNEMALPTHPGVGYGSDIAA